MQKKTFLLFILFFVCFFTFSQTIIGTNEGLFKLTNTSTVKIKNLQGTKKIVKNDLGWFILSNLGIHFTKDLLNFEEKNSGLTIKIIKTLKDGKKYFHSEVQELKDLKSHPTNPNVLVTATKDAVFISEDAGNTWKNIGISATTTGVKSVAIASLENSKKEKELVVFMSHPIYGISWKYANQRNWKDLNKGLISMPSIKWPDEIADIAVVNNNGKDEIYVSQTFLPNIYKLDWEKKEFNLIWSGSTPAGTVESLNITKDSILFVGNENIKEINLSELDLSANSNDNKKENLDGKEEKDKSEKNPEEKIVKDWTKDFARFPQQTQCAWIPSESSNNRGDISLSELWLLNPKTFYSPYAIEAANKKGNYIPVHQVTSEEGLNRHFQTLIDNKLNMLVIDMKDDYGYIRYDSKDPIVLEKGRFGRGIDLDNFVSKAEENNIFLVARIVVFKDRSLYSWGNQKYAVWDSSTNKAWQGYELVKNPEYSKEDSEDESEFINKYYDEHWVDPYSEEVWEYNIAVAKELIERGFDEIQFDYIRFPTDGRNLYQAKYRWQESGMDKESALMSFLAYARQEIKAPISIDIYGANGWYRTGARTGQDVELLAHYVDAICPMFYPSHFEQNFLAQAPAAERPYRIYYYGSYRNAIIARNHVIIRPWAQAFYLNVSYDRAWYNNDYVQRQIFGVRDSINLGYTYWNNSGRYEDLREDIDLSTEYPWEAPIEANENNRPFF